MGSQGMFCVCAYAQSLVHIEDNMASKGVGGTQKERQVTAESTAETLGASTNAWEGVVTGTTY